MWNDKIDLIAIGLICKVGVRGISALAEFCYMGRFCYLSSEEKNDFLLLWAV